MKFEEMTNEDYMKQQTYEELKQREEELNEQLKTNEYKNFTEKLTKEFEIHGELGQLKRKLRKHPDREEAYDLGESLQRRLRQDEYMKEKAKQPFKK